MRNLNGHMLEKSHPLRPACSPLGQGVLLCAGAHLGGAIVRTCDVCQAHPVEDINVACVGVQGRSHVCVCVLLVEPTNLQFEADGDPMIMFTDPNYCSRQYSLWGGPLFKGLTWECCDFCRLAAFGLYCGDSVLWTC